MGQFELRQKEMSHFELRDYEIGLFEIGYEIWNETWGDEIGRIASLWDETVSYGTVLEDTVRVETLRD